MSEPVDDTDGVVVPYGELTGAALHGLAESFVLREGTDYGAAVYSLEQKVTHVLDQLRSGDAVIIYNPRLESVDIKLTRELRRY
jgi:uncharacterized protein YheU (UPF0270 family)